MLTGTAAAHNAAEFGLDSWLVLENAAPEISGRERKEIAAGLLERGVKIGSLVAHYIFESEFIENLSDTKKEELQTADQEALAPAETARGFRGYWPSIGKSQCAWDTPQDAEEATGGEEHIRAMMLAARFYKRYRITRSELILTSLENFELTHITQTVVENGERYSIDFEKGVPVKISHLPRRSLTDGKPA